MIKRFFLPIIFGLLIGLLLIIAFPSLRYKETFSLFSSNDVISYKEAVKRAAPAVVNIYSRKTPATQSAIVPLGSGVIMDEQGYIITNNHVVENSEQIIVALQDGRIFNSELIGSDELVDIAVLKIDSDHLPVIPINTKREPHVGDVVLAIGNPYNIGQTITQGIISATGRDSLNPYRRQNFIQTDASINSGNSGGALVNTRGELVGINTLSGVGVLSQASSSINISDGISFALPTSLATKIMQKLIKDGVIVRGYIGIEGSEVTINSKENHNVVGILVKNSSGPAADADIQEEDIIISVNHKPVKSIIETMDQITNIKPGTIISVDLIRHHKEITLSLTVNEHPN